MEKYVERCIRSILNQSFSYFELLIIDDGSKDRSYEVIKSLSKTDRRIKLFKYPNGGVSAARNRGLDYVKGKYVMFIDADDYISDNYLQHIMSQVEQHKADIYIWGITKDQLNRNEKIITPNLSGSYSKSQFLSAFIIEQYKTHKGLYGYISNKLLKSDILSLQGIRFNETMKLMEDYDFFLRYYACCQSFNCFNEVGYHYVAYPSTPKIKKRTVNYTQLIDTHIRCRNLLIDNNALSELNEGLLKEAVGNLSLSAFLEIKNVSIKDIKILNQYIHERDFAIEALGSVNTQKKKLKNWILRNDTYPIFFYLIIWKLYLKFKTK